MLKDLAKLVINYGFPQIFTSYWLERKKQVANLEIFPKQGSAVLNIFSLLLILPLRPTVFLFHWLYHSVVNMAHAFSSHSRGAKGYQLLHERHRRTESWVTATAGYLWSCEMCCNHGVCQYRGSCRNNFREECTLSVHALIAFHSNFCPAIMVELRN